MPEEEKKSKYYSQAQKRATAKYKAENYKRVPFDVSKEFYEGSIKPAIKQYGKTMNKFLKDAVSEKIDRMSAGEGLTLHFPNDDIKTYKQAAEDRGMTLEEMISEAVRIFLKEY